MTGSGADVSPTAPDSGAPGCEPAPRPERLRQRAEFLNAAKGARFHAAAFSLQAIARKAGDPQESGGQGPDQQDAGPARFGFTVTRKAGELGGAQPDAPPPARGRAPRSATGGAPRF